MSEDRVPEADATSEAAPKDGQKPKRVKYRDLEDLRKQTQQLDDSLQALTASFQQQSQEPKKVVDRDAVRLWWGRALVFAGVSAGGAGVFKLFLNETWNKVGEQPYRALSSLAIFGLAFGLIHVGQRLFISEATHAEIERERARSKSLPEASPPVELIKAISDALGSTLKAAVELVKREGPKP